MSSIKKQISSSTLSIDSWLQSLVAGDRNALSRAITCVESTKPSDRQQAEVLLAGALKASKQLGRQALRIGITGAPGTGKSTLIEAWGSYLLQDNGPQAALIHKLAVLAIDPTSPLSKGSILGDKTRMHTLSQSDSAYVRPSPSGLHAGGVALATADAIILCEAAGYELIFIETVGVGQGATAVRHMIDLGVLLLLSGTGDDLQALKKGVIEIADLLVVNKADGATAAAATAWARRLAALLHKPTWAVSAQTTLGIDALWEHVATQWADKRKDWLQQRSEQRKHLLWEWILAYMKERLLALPNLAEEEQTLHEGTQSPRYVAKKLLNRYIMDQTPKQ